MNKNKCEACKERKERIYICSPLRPKAQEPERAEIELKDNLERAKGSLQAGGEARSRSALQPSFLHTVSG